MKKFKKLLICICCLTAICCLITACNKKSESESKGKSNNKSNNEELTELESQILLYIQKGLYLYDIDGEFKVYFDRDAFKSETDGVVFLVLEKEKKSWLENISYKYDKSLKKYVIEGQYEPVLVKSEEYYKMYEGSDEDEIQAVKAGADFVKTVRKNPAEGSYYEDYIIDKDIFAHITPNHNDYEDIVNKIHQYYDKRKEIEIVIQYPQLSELTPGISEGKREKINKILKEKIVGEDKVDVDSGLYTEEYISYRITKYNKSYLSLVVYATTDTRGNNHPFQWLIGITVDLEKERVISIEDVIGKTNKLSRIIKEGSYDTCELYCDFDKYNFENQEEKERVRESFYDEYKSYFNKFSSFYMRGDKIGIIMSTRRYYYSVEIDADKLKH